MGTSSEDRSTRINARLDQDHSMKLAFLRRTTGMGVSDIIKQGIDVLYRRAREQRRDPFAILSDSGFIGSGAGQSDLSERYKDELAEVLQTKHGHR